MSLAPAFDSMRKWVIVTVHEHSDVRWSFDLTEGKELLRVTLDKRTGNTHFLPTPEEIRGHKLGTSNVFHRAEGYFMLRAARGAAESAGLSWTLAWRFVTPTGEVMYEDVGR